MDKQPKLIDAEKLLVWLSGRMGNTGSDDRYFAYESVQEAIEADEFAPDPIPPTIKQGDSVSHKVYGDGIAASDEVTQTTVKVDFDLHTFSIPVKDLEISHD